MRNEITMKLKCDINKFYSILESKGFKIVDKFLLDDTYFIPEEVEIKNLTPREILKSYILLRNITQYMPKEHKIFKITYKVKNICNNGDIISQENIDCEINYLSEGKNFIEAIGYREIMNIKENNIVYGKDGFQIAVKDIENGDNLIEIETVEDNPKYNTTDKLKEKINELQIPVDTNDYFVKKAEIELKKII